MNILLRRSIIFLAGLLFWAFVPAQAAFLSSLDISSPPSLLEVGADYVLLEVPHHAKAKGYKVFYSDKPFRGDEKTFVASEGKNVVLIQNLQAGIRYYFTAVVFDAEGNESESFSPSISLRLAREGESALLDYTTPFKDELNLTDTPSVINNGDGTVTVSWNGISDASYYKLYFAKDRRVDRSFHPFVKVYGRTSAVLANLQPNTTYFFSVVAVDRAGYESTLVSPNISASFAQIPALSGNSSLALALPPAAIVVDQYNRTLRWESVPGADSYIIWKSRYPFTNTMFSSPFMAVEQTKNTFWSVGADPEEPIFYVAVQAVASDGTRGTLSTPVKIIFPHDGKRKHLGLIFSDIDESSWYASALIYLLQEGIVAQNNEKRFHPGENITRAAFSKMLLELRRLPLVSTPVSYGHHAFCDVDYGSWYGVYVATMTQYRFTQGYGGAGCSFGRDFRPATNVSRAEALRFLFQAFQIDPKALVGNQPSEFTDVRPEDWFHADVVFASRINLVSGYVRDGKKYYDPHRTITRAEAAQLMYKFITQLDYQYHQDGTNYLYQRHDSRYRQSLNVAGRPTAVSVTPDVIQIAWNPILNGRYYRILISPERMITQSTRALVVLSIDADKATTLGDGRLSVELPRAQFPGEYYSISVVAFDDGFNESLNYGPVVALTLDALPDGDKLEELLFVPEEREGQTASQEDTVVRDEHAEEVRIEPVPLDADCAYVLSFLERNTAAYGQVVERCSTFMQPVTELTGCAVLSDRIEQMQCYAVQGYRSHSVATCNELQGDAKQACFLGLLLEQPNAFDCNAMSILPKEQCTYIVKTAEAVNTTRQSTCNMLPAADQPSCFAVFARHRYNPTMCKTYLNANAVLVQRKDPSVMPIATTCTEVHLTTEVLDTVQSLEDKKRKSDVEFIASLFDKYLPLEGSFPVAARGECLDASSLVRQRLIDRQLSDAARFPIDPVTTGNTMLCPNSGGVYYYRSLVLSGQTQGGYMLVTQMEQPDATTPLFTEEELAGITTYSDMKALLDVRSVETNPVGAKLYVHLGK